MYSYDWDSETGGYVLNISPLSLSPEPRPVYYRELDLLGFDRYWRYPKSDEAPLLWATATVYIYRGIPVAKVNGGSLCKAPELTILTNPEPDGGMLRFVDIPAMIRKNRDIMEALTQETIKRIYNTYVNYQKKVDVFYVAFSGGKDSVVTLDLVRRSLPHDSFKVLFGDTKMEFPDTYKIIDKVKRSCEEENIEFLISTSDLEIDYTWRQFGPPATVNRWCCSVHKTSPQILLLREKLNKTNFTGMAFIGVRASESAARSDYDYISLGEKHKGQYSCNPILEWNSAEVFLYIYQNHLFLNDAYKKGNRRAGCLVCPRAVERNEYICSTCYPDEFKKYQNLITEAYKDNFQSEEQLQEFVKNGGWKARKNGRDIRKALNYKEEMSDDGLTITVSHPQTEWREWIKTIGVLENTSSPYRICFRGKQRKFVLVEDRSFIKVTVDLDTCQEDGKFIKYIKNVFRKTAFCIGCRECEADCHNGCISIKKGSVKIRKDCRHCAECHKAEKGCLVYKSLEMPKGGSKMEQKTLNCYCHFGPKMEWILQYFRYKNEFDANNDLGSQMYSFFKRFLRDSKLLDTKGFSRTAQIVEKVGLDNDSTWALLLVNLAYTPQIAWFIKNCQFNTVYERGYISSKLAESGAKDTWIADIWSSFSRFIDLPFSKVGLGEPVKEKNKTVAFSRVPWNEPNGVVVLYSLYKFSEACGGYAQFSLTRLLNHNIERNGVSPSEIFGLDREIMEKTLQGLAANYPDFISVSFTHDLDNINLRDKTSEDVLEIFY